MASFHAKKSYLYGGILLLPGIMLGYLFVILYLKENLYLILLEKREDSHIG